MANHSEQHVEHTEAHKEHIGIPGYAAVFGILVVGTILTYVVALQDLADGARRVFLAGDYVRLYYAGLSNAAIGSIHPVKNSVVYQNLC
jgi:hypothetical protein